MTTGKPIFTILIYDDLSASVECKSKIKHHKDDIWISKKHKLKFMTPGGRTLEFTEGYKGNK